MRRLPLMALWLLSCATLCAACGNHDKPAPLPQLEIVKPVVPAHLLECAEAPPELDPDDPSLTQKKLVKAYVLERAAGSDCRSKLNEVKGLLKAETVDERGARNDSGA